MGNGLASAARTERPKDGAGHIVAVPTYNPRPSTYGPTYALAYRRTASAYLKANATRDFARLSPP
ncbi:MAG: hypothetical protein KF842_08465 [Caulobacter sp.]|nr:hypothetical protein [Caulobacter sp.]